MTITVTNKVKADLMAGIDGYLTEDRTGMRFDAMRIEDGEKEGAVRVIFSLSGVDMFFYSAHGCRLTGGVISLYEINGSVPISLSLV